MMEVNKGKTTSKVIKADDILAAGSS